MARLRGNFEILGHLRGCLDVGLLLFINEHLRNCWTVQRNVWTFQAPWFRNKMFKGNHSMTLSSFSLKDWYGLHKVFIPSLVDTLSSRLTWKRFFKKLLMLILLLSTLPRNYLDLNPLQLTQKYSVSNLVEISPDGLKKK